MEAGSVGNTNENFPTWLHVLQRKQGRGQAVEYEITRTGSDAIEEFLGSEIQDMKESVSKLDSKITKEHDLLRDEVGRLHDLIQTLVIQQQQPLQAATKAAAQKPLREQKELELEVELLNRTSK